MASVLLSWPRGRFQDIVHPEDHLRGLGGLNQHLPLHAETLCDPEPGHAVNLALVLKIKPRLTSFPVSITRFSRFETPRRKEEFQVA